MDSRSTPEPAARRLMRLAGGLFLIDGASLVLRGVVGGLFLFYETAGTAFVIIFLLHTFVCGTL